MKCTPPCSRHEAVNNLAKRLEAGNGILLERGLQIL